MRTLKQRTTGWSSGKPVTDSILFKPTINLHEVVSDAMDPRKQPSKVRSLCDMDEREILELERQYGCKVKR